ncbi:hypothetical protein JIN77_14310 [Verrucomicrobiaceae bacterium R5-34]|nr:hypothetical protein [Verrucomicrobiaceae bacterium R5-34]
MVNLSNAVKSPHPMLERPYIKLTRRFRKLDIKDLELDREGSDERGNWFRRNDAPTWTDLEKRYRTVILAEGGSGKTREMQEKQKALTTKGKYAFFLPLEALADDSVENLLKLESLDENFQLWRDNTQDHAWVFLDAVDELKLKDGRFKKALQQLKQALGPAESRTHIYISCRPSDWKEIDIRDFQVTLPPPRLTANTRVKESPEHTIEPLSAEEYFLAPLIKDASLDINTKKELTKSNIEAPEPEALEIYHLHELDNEQISKFIREYDKDIADPLLEELKIKDRWSFARRPQDLIEVISLWQAKKTLGTYTEQYEAFLRASLREREDRPGESTQLAPGLAQSIAGRIAFALAVSRKRTICSPTSTSNPDTNLDSLQLIQDVNSSDIKALMRLRLFDPATYDRIKFHRRDVEQYLAAKHIRKTFDIGVGSKRALLDLFFAKTTDGERVLIPSRKQLAVWLAQWNSEVRDQLIAVDPVLLVSDADAEQLSIEDKIRILRAIAKLPASRLRSALPYDATTLHRFGAPELAPTINQLWPEAHSSRDLSAFLLKLIKESEIAECSDLLYDAAFSKSIHPLDKVTAIRALVNLGDGEKVTTIVDTIMASPNTWPGKTVRTIVADLFPDYITVSQLGSLISNLGEKKSDYNFNFGQSLNSILEKTEPSSSEALALRNELAQLILVHQSPGSAYYSPRSQMGWLAVILAETCHRQSHQIPAEDKASFLHCCIVASHFREHNYQEQSIALALREAIQNSALTHEEIYRAEFEFIAKHFKEQNGSLRVRPQYSLISTLTNADREWLEAIISETQDLHLALMTYRELLALWSQRGSPEEDIDQLRAMANDKSHLGDMLQSWLEPQEPHPLEEKWEKRKKKQEKKEAKRIEGWKSWRDDLIANPSVKFSQENYDWNIHNFFHWLFAGERSGGRYQAWDSNAIEAAFGADIVERVRELFCSYWRNADVKTYSERTENHNSTPYSWIYALNGVLAEAEIPNWAHKLTVDEAKHATRLAQVEINGLASYLEDLADAHEEIVAEELSRELVAQLELANERQHLPLLQDLTHASTPIKKLVTPALQHYISQWTAPEETNGAAQHNVSEVLRILLDVYDANVIQDIETAALANFKSTPTSPSSVEWLRCLMILNAASATTAIEEALAQLDLSLRKSTALRWFGTLFDRMYGSTPIPTDPHILARLVIIAYTNILPSEDRQRPSGEAYTPDLRDGAQHARSSLLNALIDLQHHEVPSILNKMAEDPVFESVQNYIQNRAHIITINNLESAPWSISDIQSFETKLERLPVDRDSLNQLIQNRLDDLQHDILHHDYFPRKTVREIIQEDEMQRMLALLLEKDSNGLYSIAREDEAADGKKTDIRISVSNDLKAVIELKLADKRWSVSELEKAIEDQLQQQYLRHKNCRIGYFIITNHGGHKNRIRANSQRDLERKYWQHPTTKLRMNWECLLSHLQNKANALAAECPVDIKLTVSGIDLRDPELKPAH